MSVVIPVFNSARFIGTALKSVFAQTFPDFEVIVVDDGSEDHDELREAIGSWAERIHYLRQPNGGPASARNTAIARATGDLVAFLDADDEWLPDKLAVQVAYYDRHPQTGLLHCAMTDEPRRSAAVPGPPRNLFCELFHSAFFVNTLTVMVPRRVLVELGGFDERREVHIEDYDLWLRIAARYPIGYIPIPLACHRPGGFMSSQLERTYTAQALVMEKNKPLCAMACAAHRSSPGRCDRLRRHVLHRDWGYDRLQTGNRKEAREQLARAIACKPWDAYTLALYLSTFLSSEWRARVRRVVAVVH